MSAKLMYECHTLVVHNHKINVSKTLTYLGRGEVTLIQRCCVYSEEGD